MSRANKRFRKSIFTAAKPSAAALRVNIAGKTVKFGTSVPIKVVRKMNFKPAKGG